MYDILRQAKHQPGNLPSEVGFPGGSKMNHRMGELIILLAGESTFCLWPKIIP
jgi:hypothetical protein